ncbi:hypothetical protein IKJ53_03415 [bacterium]|nr:hypothetical protein [bacterium]
MIKSIIVSILATTAIVFGVGYWVNGWFLQGYNWLWIAIPSLWVTYQIFLRFFKVLDILIGIGIIVAIIMLKMNGFNLPFLG